MWTIEYLPVALKERDDLPRDMRARLFSMVELISAEGFAGLPREWAKPLGSKLWELRITGKDGIARAIYVTMKEQRIVVVRIFIKKTQKTPPQELDLARKRARDVT